ncbi:RidA family protein [Psychromonas sp. CD1]|uniref:RidA family protein n=1 Tax=Psychromonas sp. CD1 TaxID=1979839 RepID=UPI000B9B6069|nr:RidA family protein [Psychromonas sp. CD1]
MIIETNKAPKAIGPYSQAVKAGEYVYVSGCVPFSPKDGSVVGENIKDQTRQVMENLKSVVEASGKTMLDVVKTTCFISDLENFVEFNAIYAEYFTAGAFPARSCVEVARLPKDVLIEVEAIIYLNK